MTLSAVAPPTARSGESYSFGRWKQPIPTPDIVSPGLFGSWRLKEWHYLSVATPRWFVAFAFVNLGYAGKVFAYLVDRERPTEKQEYTRLHPFAIGLSFAESSVRGETTWKDGANTLRVRYQNGWQVKVDLDLGKARLVGEFSVDDAEALALLYRLPSGLPAYTHKASGLRASGRLSVGDTGIDLSEGVASIDWTRSIALRETRWLWSSLQGRTAQGNLIGLNLSAKVYDDAQGNSQENALWLDGKVHALDGVVFDLPNDPRTEPWRIRSKNDGVREVDLIFTPYGTREEQVNFGIIRSSFIQPYGSYQGTLCPKELGVSPLSVDGLFGVVETHHCIW